MKALPIVKLLLLIALAAWMQILTFPARANEAVAAAATSVSMPSQPLASVPETSSVVLLATVGLMLMLRRRRLHA